MTDIDVEQVTSAVVAALNGQLTETAEAYTIDDVPATRPSEYVEVTLSRTTGGEPRRSGRVSTRGYRVACRAVSSTSTANVGRSLDLCDRALVNNSLSIDGERTTPARLDAEDTPGPDSGWFSGLRTYTFVI